VTTPVARRLYAASRLGRTRALKLSRIARKPAFWSPLGRGVAASVEHSRVPFDPGLRTVLDVGASRGQFAVLAMERFPHARILCFEPLPQAQEALAAVTRGRAEIHQVALGLRSERRELVVSARDDSSSLLPIAQRHIDEYPGTESESSIEVGVATLADFLHEGLPGPRLLKLDVQGMELDVLRGAGERLSLIDEVFVECSFVELYIGQAYADDVVCFLRDAGLRLVGIHGLSVSVDNATLQADLHFRRAAKVIQEL
jgi:FkbM family methyltransferase